MGVTGPAGYMGPRERSSATPFYTSSGGNFVLIGSEIYLFFDFLWFIYTILFTFSFS